MEKFVDEVVDKPSSEPSPGRLPCRDIGRRDPGKAPAHPLLVGLQLGQRRLGNQQAERNVRAMIELARRRHIEVLLIATPEPGLFPSPPAFYAAVAKDLHVPYEGDVITEVLKDARLKSDPIHPNAAGYRIIAERVAAVLTKNGAL